MPCRVAFVAFGALMAMPARAEVVSASDAAFEIMSAVSVQASPEAVYAALQKPGDWWNDAHSHSRDSANMSIAARAGGCFCERMADGGAVEHGRVIHAQPGKMLRFIGGLGPLQSEAITATMTWTIEPTEKGARITQRYVASGYMNNGLKAIAPPVDAVLTEQLTRLKLFLDKAD